jgi:dolichyl-phosphate-mannose--protein O-mannosyl transferase
VDDRIMREEAQEVIMDELDLENLSHIEVCIYAYKYIVAITAVTGSKPRQALFSSGGSVGLKNTRITEGTQRFILVRANWCPTSSS